MRGEFLDLSGRAALLLRGRDARRRRAGRVSARIPDVGTSLGRRRAAHARGTSPRRRRPAGLRAQRSPARARADRRRARRSGRRTARRAAHRPRVHRRTRIRRRHRTVARAPPRGARVPPLPRQLDRVRRLADVRRPDRPRAAVARAAAPTRRARARRARATRRRPSRRGTRVALDRSLSPSVRGRRRARRARGAPARAAQRGGHTGRPAPPRDRGAERRSSGGSATG